MRLRHLFFLVFAGAAACCAAFEHEFDENYDDETQFESAGGAVDDHRELVNHVASTMQLLQDSGVFQSDDEPRDLLLGFPTVNQEALSRSTFPFLDVLESLDDETLDSIAQVRRCEFALTVVGLEALGSDHCRCCYSLVIRQGISEANPLFLLTKRCRWPPSLLRPRNGCHATLHLSSSSTASLMLMKSLSTH